MEPDNSLTPQLDQTNPSPSPISSPTFPSISTTPPATPETPPATDQTPPQIVEDAPTTQVVKKTKIWLWVVLGVLGAVVVSLLLPYLFLRNTISSRSTNAIEIEQPAACYVDSKYCLLKPIIYLYPRQETSVTVSLGKADKLTHTYPQYPTTGWQVVAQPNGDLRDPQTGKTYYSLYWEGLNTTTNTTMEEGFVVAGKSTAEFLEEKLAILGLSAREANEFIIYWLPQLEINNYNFIRFQTEAEINANMPLTITPTPDSLIRVMMSLKGLDDFVSVREQELVTPTRTGFVVVEWGGTILP